jgi:hypothetical protein
MSTKPLIGLSIDWDYFALKVPMEAEDRSFFYEHAWTLRRLANKQYPFNYRRARRFGLELSGNKRPFVIADDCQCLVTESHYAAYDFFPRELNELHSFDYHHDCHNFEQKLTCGNWLYHYRQKKNQDAKIAVHFPTTPIRYQWRHAFGTLLNLGIDFDSKVPRIENVTHLFICRSSPWTDPKHDRDFARFVRPFYSSCDPSVRKVRFLSTSLQGVAKALDETNFSSPLDFERDF